MILLLIIMSWSTIDTSLLQERLLAGKLAQHDLLVYARLNAPHPYAPLDVRQSKYQWKAHHRLIADELQKLESGKLAALEIETPPRYGKSEMAVRNFVSWHAGKHPELDLLVVTATADLATEHGRDVRDYMRGPGYKLTFGHNPKTRLREDSQSATRLQLEGGGKLHFFGRGQIPAGVGGFGIIFDDFFKNAEDAYSEVTRDTAWRNYVADCLSRLNNSKAWKLLIGSRKHEDDVQGRQFDPTNLHYDEPSATQFRRIRIPALSEGADTDPLGREKDEVCWPERFPKEFYIAKRQHKSEIVRIDFETQDQCNPTPGEGMWFKKDWFCYYKPGEEPKHCRNYCASDHAYRIKQKNDESCILKAKLSPDYDIYISPDTVWKKIETDELADEMFTTIKNFQPVMWWAARDAISGSILPFLRQRMASEKVFFWIDDNITESKDLVQRSASIRAMFALRKVYLPLGWAELERAKKQLISFPGAKDDFVAALAMLGMGLDKMNPSQHAKPADVPKKGTLAWHTHGQNKTPEHAPAAWWKS